MYVKINNLFPFHILTKPIFLIIFGSLFLIRIALETILANQMLVSNLFEKSNVKKIRVHNHTRCISNKRLLTISKKLGWVSNASSKLQVDDKELKSLRLKVFKKE